MQTTYRTIPSKSEAEFKDRGSRFLAVAIPVRTSEEIKHCIKQLRETHPKAVHVCYAYRLGTDGTSYRAVDDGEPSGSAGKPILGQIDSAGLTNVLVAVVRYFGGTLLGVPGLINAYKSSAHEAIKAASVIEKNIEINLQIEFPYLLMNEVMRILKSQDIPIVQQEMELFCRLTIAIPLLVFDHVKDKLSKLHNLTIQ